MLEVPPEGLFSQDLPLLQASLCNGHQGIKFGHCEAPVTGLVSKSTSKLGRWMDNQKLQRFQRRCHKTPHAF